MSFICNGHILDKYFTEVETHFNGQLILLESDINRVIHRVLTRDKDAFRIPSYPGTPPGSHYVDYCPLVVTIKYLDGTEKTIATVNGNKNDCYFHRTARLTRFTEYDKQAKGLVKMEDVYGTDNWTDKDWGRFNDPSLRWVSVS